MRRHQVDIGIRLWLDGWIQAGLRHDRTEHGIFTVCMYTASGGHLDTPRRRGGAQPIGSCTVTSLVPSGKVASIWISGSIEAMPSITSWGPSRVVP